jgi:hypothetical protein
MADYLRVNYHSLRRSLSRGDYKDMPIEKLNKYRSRLFDKNKVMAWIEKNFNNTKKERLC